MVRLSLSFLATAFAAVASAAPVYTQLAFKKIADARCLPQTDIKEYQSFELLSHELDTYVSKKFGSTRLVGGVNGDKNMQKLEFCIVSSDHHCDPIFPTNCVLENVDYRFRVKGNDKGYLQIDGHYVRIVRNFEDASPLSLSNDDLLGVRIAYQYEGGDKNVLSTSKSAEYGKPIVLEYPQKNRIRQRFEIIESRKAVKKIVGDNECIPETNIKEYHPFKLLSANLDTYLSMKPGSKMVYGGAVHDPALQALDFCIVSTDMECTTAIPTNCIYQNVEYRFRVFGPVKGYLRVIDEELIEIVPEFNQASGLNLYKEQGWGLRVAHRKSNRDLLVITTSAPGHMVFLEEPQKNNGRQWFDLVQPQGMNMDIESAPNQCVPHVAVKEYEAFELYSYDLDSFVSNLPGHDVVVGGDPLNKHLQQLQFCIVSSDHKCNPAFPTNCIYENVQYRYRVHGPEKGYLRIQDGLARIVPEFEDATGLNLMWDDNRGLRIAKQNKKGSVSVLATTVPGKALTLQGATKPTDSQYFALSKLKKTTPFKRCLPDTYVKVNEPFIVKNNDFDTLISTVMGDDLLRAGIDGNKLFQKLEFTVTPYFINDDAAGECLREDFQYRFEVTGQISGFIRVEDGFLTIVPEFDAASPLYFHKSSGQGLRIGQNTPMGPFAVAADHPGSPLIFQRPESGNKRQVFDLIPSNRVIKEEWNHECLPDTHIAVGAPFLIENHALSSFVSVVRGDSTLRGGVSHNPDFTVLRFFLHPYRGMGHPGECAKEDVEYIFEVRDDDYRGFLQVQNGFLVIVPFVHEASPLYFHKSRGEGVRIGQNTPEGPRAVATVESGMPLVFEQPQSKNKNQVFDLVPLLRENEKVEACDDKQEHSLCIFLRGGVDKVSGLQRTVFDLKSYDEDVPLEEYVYGDVEYLLRASIELSRFLRVEGSYLAIVPGYDSASPLYFHKPASGSLRVDVVPYVANKKTVCQ
ncbi:hypothetical protein BG006_011281 [Podila minutissima]|uniref:Uncharacterized protein n=1 Tax=Podila minutissima TaxID=64525 RepID=A0A9P5VI09_9FUNG|nr:hypothetical protein BG006_011281 [Podila minutissima]